ncbi:hypothetical protein [Snodgrassella alvi]|nr:hypothetical protein [Snodgrassella alvi]
MRQVQVDVGHLIAVEADILGVAYRYRLGIAGYYVDRKTAQGK